MEAAGKIYIAHRSRSDVFTIYNFSDLHLGNKATNVKQLRKDVKKVADDPFSFWLGGGDYAEFISPKDKRFDPQCVSEDIGISDMGRLGSLLTARVRDELDPIKHKCLGLLFGNHEHYYMKAMLQQDLHAWLCVSLGVPNFGYSAMFHLVFCRNARFRAPNVPRIVSLDEAPEGARNSFTFFVHHGAGYAQTAGGKVNRLEKALERFDCDVAMMGHLHDRNAVRRSTLGLDKNGTHIVQREQVGVMSGSYLMTYAQGVTTYGEVKMYAPVPFGPSCVTIRPEGREIAAAV